MANSIKMYSVLDIAKYFLLLVDRDEGDTISNLKLQKLVYYAQGYHLALCDRPLFKEKIKAWKYGPVVPELWHEYKSYGPKQIDIPSNFKKTDLTKKTRDFLDQIWCVYGQYSAVGLRNLTHEEPPWKDTPQPEEISHDSMKSFFSTLVNEQK